MAYMNIPLPAIFVIFGTIIAIVIVLLLPLPRFLTKESTSSDRVRSDDMYRDDDQYWFGVFFYNNPGDPAMFVPKRYGFGWTVNFGNPRGKVFMIGMLILPLVIVLLSAFFPVASTSGCHPSGCHLFP
jgi:uncharacterized membrane protein